MGVCHSKKTKKNPPPSEKNPNPPQTQNPQPQPQPQPKKEDDTKKKYEDNDNLDNNAEIVDENLHQSHMKNVNREFLPNQVYTQHLNSIMRGMQDTKAYICEFGQTEPMALEDGLYTMETHGSFGKKIA